MNRKIIFLILVFILIPDFKTEFITENPEYKQDQIVLMAVGDIMLNRGVELKIKQNQENFNFPFLKIKEYLNEADLIFGNLESVISDKGTNVGSIYSFRANPKTINGLTYAGFNIVSVANNHAFDYTRKALEDSLIRLKQAKISYVGAGFGAQEAHSVVIKQINQTKIGFLAYNGLGSRNWQATKDSSGIAWLDENIASDIKQAKAQTDILIVSMHFGDEYAKRPNGTQTYFAQLAIDSGADLVIGHHPHVIQPVEKYKNKYIAYSLGNFVFDQPFSKETMKGLLLKVLIQNKEIKEVIPVNIEINKDFQPEVVK